MGKIVIVLALLLSIALCSKMESKLDSREFQEIIEDFVEVNSLASKDNDIPLLLATIKLEIQNHDKKYSEFINTFRVSCQNARSKVASFVKGLDLQINDYRSEVNAFSGDAKSALEKNKKNDRNIIEADSKLKSVESRIKNAYTHYQIQLEEADQKLVVVKKIRDLLEDELLNITKRTSLVEFKNTIKENLSKLQKLSTNSKSGNVYSGIISAMVQMASKQNFTDQETLKEILRLLNQLHKRVEEFTKNLKYDLDQLVKEFNDEQFNLENQIRDYSLLGQRYISTINDSHHNIKILNQEIKDLNSEVKRKNDELNSLNKLCHTENVIFKKLARATKELIFTISHAFKKGLEAD